MSKYLPQLIPVTFIISLFFVLAVSLAPLASSAAVTAPSQSAATSYTPPTEGLVNCGKGDSGPLDCNFKKLLDLINSVMSFFMYAIVFPVSIGLIIYAGGTMVWYGNINPGKAKGAKTMLQNILIGFAIVFSAYMIVHALFGYFVSQDTSTALSKAMKIIFGN